MSFPFAPDQASTYAYDVDNLFFLLTGLTVFFSILVLVLMLFFAVRYRRGNKVSRKNPSTGDLRLELAWSLGPLFIGLGVYIMATKPFTYVYRPPADAMEIFVIGKRWMWHIQHDNGIRENNELHVPVGRAIKLTMISQDVIHGFYVPAFRMKRDVLPGRYNTCWFQATKPGKYHLFCSEYCGTNHSEMEGWVYVMDPVDFQRWKDNNGNREVLAHQTLEQEGESLFQTLACGNCHGALDNVHGPSLYGLFGRKRRMTDGQTVVADDDYIRESIVNPHAKIVDGYQDIMQGYPTGEGPGYLTEEQLLSLVTYIKSLGVASPTATAQPSPARTTGKPLQGASSVRHGAMTAASGSRSPATSGALTANSAQREMQSGATLRAPLRAGNAIVDTNR